MIAPLGPKALAGGAGRGYTVRMTDHKLAAFTLFAVLIPPAAAAFDAPAAPDQATMHEAATCPRR